MDNGLPHQAEEQAEAEAEDRAVEVVKIPNALDLNLERMIPD